ncbi:conserved hypothetical protein, partial [Ricinus communis]
QQGDEAPAVVQQRGRLVRQQQQAVVAALGMRVVGVGALVLVGQAQRGGQVASGHVLGHVLVQLLAGDLFGRAHRRPVGSAVCLGHGVDAQRLMVLVHHIAQQAGHDPAEIDHGEVEQRQQDQPAEQRQQQRHGNLRTAAQQEQKKAQQRIGLADDAHRVQDQQRIECGEKARRLHQHDDAGRQQKGQQQQGQLRHAQAHPRTPADDDAVHHQNGEQLPGQMGPVRVQVARIVRSARYALRTQRCHLETIAAGGQQDTDLHQPDGQGCGQEEQRLEQQAAQRQKQRIAQRL